MTAQSLAIGMIQSEHGPTLAVLRMRSDRIGADGRTSAIESPRCGEIEVAGWRPEEDLGLDKPCTDLVVAGVAHAPRGRYVPRMDVGIELPERGCAVALRVVGERRARVRHGVLTFEDPAPFSVIPIDWTRAYGGVDPNAAAEPDDALDPVAFVLAFARGGVGSSYPRNPLGRGWCVGSDLARFDDLVLPNVEDPRRPLRPDHLLVTRASAWARQPIPLGFGWVDPDWFPRCAHAGVVPECDTADAIPDRPRSPLPSLLWSGGAPGLAVAALRGGEVVWARGLDPSGEFAVRLPSPPPAVAIRSGAPVPVNWRMHTAAIDVEARVVHTLWRAELPVPRAWRSAGPMRRMELLRDAQQSLAWRD